MIKNLIYILVAFFVVMSCNNNKIERPKKPNNLIKKDEMVNILYDMAVITAAKGTQLRIMEKNGVVPEQLIFKKYQIDSMQFVLSNEYYSYDIDTYAEMFEEVKKRIQAEKVIEDSLVKQLNEDRRKDIDKRKQDSTALRKPNDARPSKNTDTLQ